MNDDEKRDSTPNTIGSISVASSTAAPSGSVTKRKSELRWEKKTLDVTKGFIKQKSKNIGNSIVEWRWFAVVVCRFQVFIGHWFRSSYINMLLVMSNTVTHPNYWLTNWKERTLPFIIIPHGEQSAWLYPQRWLNNPVYWSGVSAQFDWRDTWVSNRRTGALWAVLAEVNVSMTWLGRLSKYAWNTV